MNKTKVVTALFGILSLVFVAGFHFYGKHQTFADDELEAERNEIALNQKVTGLTASNSNIDILGFLVRRVKLSYEKKIKENQTPSFDLFYELEVLMPVGQMDLWSEFQKTKKEVAVELSSAGFDISPTMTISKNKGTLTPIHFAWTINPKSDGDHNLLLNVSSLIEEPEWPSYIAGSAYTINGEDSNIPRDGILKMPIEVVNIFGIKRATYESIKLGIGFIGFILMFPLLHEILKKKLGLG